MPLQVLHPDVVREVLRGHESHVDQISKTDAARRAAAAQKACSEPGCTLPTVVRTPSDPLKVFDAEGVLYEGHCPRHGRIT